MLYGYGYNVRKVYSNTLLEVTQQDIEMLIKLLNDSNCFVNIIFKVRKMTTSKFDD